ncbi:uncharacterized protein SAPINGB_P000418 [Magnusiomyces paraingens]|uniref:Carboxylic ester hydrolase n=1 Tax=Magnusiomyces paraingens TaxID=2606893 RepID=A0A5E8B480_9ASCO|nr:uncharacterized protein SAPINGB_P000418 [Saprochaete ingens]VVT44443.1 unnamed protein product [Saprochaete ingens]
MLLKSILLVFFVSSVIADINYPTVTVNGNQDIRGAYLANGTVESFRGIPFGQPPIGELSFRRPVAFNGSYAGFNATDFGYDCPAPDILSSNSGLSSAVMQYSGYLAPELKLGLAKILISGAKGDDCLNLNVFRPANTTAKDKLPVLVWIYGGAFIFGGSSSYKGEVYVGESLQMQMPMIYVSINYRLGPWGFLGGREAAEDGNTNAGLLDQRLALEWVQDHIGEFGGDPQRVTIAGESAGAMSCAHQMVMNDGDHTYKGSPLFSSVIMQSGGVLPVNNVSSSWPQKAFDTVINGVGCDGADDKIACLRTKNTTEVTKASSGVSMVDAFLGFSPHPDGDVISSNTFELFRKGKFAKVPYITGNQEDEGTLFTSLFSNYTSEAQVIGLFQSFFPDASADEVAALVAYYPENPAAGSPFRTALLNAQTPQYKRISAFLCDLLFQSPRRLMLENTPSDVPVYSYLSSTGFGTPYLGTFHAVDLVWQYTLDFGPSKVYKRYWISFAHSGTPNNGTGLPYWPEYRQAENDRNLLGINVATLGLVEDSFREDGIGLLKNSTSLQV